MQAERGLRLDRERAQRVRDALALLEADEETRIDPSNRTLGLSGRVERVPAFDITFATN